MPELPDVEIYKRYLNNTSLHKDIADCRIFDTHILDHVSQSHLRNTLTGSRFEESMRHGKYTLARLANSDWLTIHFGMTGFLKYFKKGESMSDHLQLVIDFTNGYHLGYGTVRKLGSIGLAKDPSSFLKENNLGIDALDENLTFEVFQNIATANRIALKSFLMRQNIICGIGNIYADEICFQAGLHPKKKIKNFNYKQLKTLFTSIKNVLNTAIDCRADPAKLPPSYLIPHRMENDKCPGCSGRVYRLQVSGRSTYYCPECQK